MRDSVTLAEAAALTGVSTDTVKRRIKSGQLPAQRVGKKYRIKLADLDALALQAEVQDVITSALQGVSDQIQRLAQQLGQRDADLVSLHKNVSALVTKAGN